MGDTINGLLLLGVLFGIYWIPTIVAFNRTINNQWSIAVINLFLGWTLIGWVVALAMAVRSQTGSRAPSGDHAR